MTRNERKDGEPDVGDDNTMKAAEAAEAAASGGEAEKSRRQRMRSIAIALALVLLVVLFYAATIVRLGGNVMNKGI